MDHVFFLLCLSFRVPLVAAIVSLAQKVSLDVCGSYIVLHNSFLSSSSTAPIHIILQASAVF